MKYLRTIIEPTWQEGQWYDFYLSNILNNQDIYGPGGKLMQIEMSQVTAQARRFAKAAALTGGMATEIADCAAEDREAAEASRGFIQWLP